MKRFKLRPVYLLYLLLPLAYYLAGPAAKEPAMGRDAHKDYVYFSVRSKDSCRVVLSDNVQKLSAWDIHTAACQNLQFVGDVNDSAGLRISVENLHQGDTLFITAIHLFRGGRIFSAVLDNKNMGAENGIIINKKGAAGIIVKEGQKPVIIKLPPASGWETVHRKPDFPLIFVLLFFIAAALLLIINPSVRYFIFILVVSLITMLAWQTTATNLKGRAEIKTTTGIHHAEIYYNNTPFFSSGSRYVAEDTVPSFNVPVDFGNTPYLRFDLGGGDSRLKDLKVCLRLGFFGKTYDIESLISDKAVLHDIETAENNNYIRGADPYIMLTSAEIMSDIGFLIFLHSRMYLYAALGVFLMLLICTPFLGAYFERRFHFSYLIYALLPVVCLLLAKPQLKNADEGKPAQFYFSVCTSDSSVISLINGNDTLTSWQCLPGAFHYYHYKGPLDSLKSLSLSIRGLCKGDTLQLLSANLYRKGEVFNVWQLNEDACIIKNASVYEDKESLHCIVKNSGDAVAVNLLPFYSLNNSGLPDRTALWIWLIFLTGFIPVLMIKPGTANMVSVSLVSVFLMGFYYWVCRDIQFRVYLSASSPVRHTQLFFSPDPTFELLNRYNMDCDTSVFLAQVDLKETPFMRFDVADSTRLLDDFKIKAKTGLMQRVWNFSTLPYNQLLLNDMIRRDGRFFITGPDPYVAFSTMQNNKSIRQFIYFREQVFIVLSLVVFLILLVITEKYIGNHKRHFVFSSVFILLAGYGLVLRLFNSDSLVFMSEMRVAYPKPVVQFDSAKVFLKQLDAYIKDQIPGRNSIVVMNNLIEYSLFRQLLNNRNVHFGRDGWMFFIGDNCRENYENRTPLTQEQLEAMRKVLVSRHEWLKERGIKFYLVFPPMAYFVYEEKVGPRLWRYNQKTKLEQLLEYLRINTDLNIIDIYNPLMEAKKKYPIRLYYKDNTHWNFFGSYVAYRAMIQYIIKDFDNMEAPLPLNKINWTEYKEYYSDFFKLVGIYKYYKYNEVMPVIDNEPVPDTIMPKYPELVSPVYPFTVINRHKKDKPNMLLYGDSFSGYQLTYLAYNFFNSTYLWTPLFYPTIIEKERPDIVIQEMADYTILNLLNPNPPLTELKDTIETVAD